MDISEAVDNLARATQAHAAAVDARAKAIEHEQQTWIALDSAKYDLRDAMRLQGAFV